MSGVDGRWLRTNGGVAAVGLIVLGVCGLGARGGHVSGAERSVFHAVNDLPSWLYRPMFVVQQSGNLIVALLVVLALAVVLRNWRLGAGGVAALAMKLVLERVVKAVVERQRPASSVGDVVLRGRVSAHGLSFVSGHAVITVALAVLLTPLLPGRWRLVPWAVVAANAVARIYVGAHNPLDVLGGAGLGLFIGAVVNLVFDPPRGARRWHGAAPAVPTGPAVVVG